MGRTSLSLRVNHSTFVSSDEALYPVKGYVPTPASVVDVMVEKLFRDRLPTDTSTLLDPGCGPGAFIDGVLRWCAAHQSPIPRIVGVESDPRHASAARTRFREVPQVEIQERDFLRTSPDRYDSIIGNPPYVPITELSPHEREEYRARFVSARGRFDLYLLFFEQAASLLKPEGRLVFITPEKFLYVGTAGPLRELLSALAVEELHFLAAATFGDLVTYPLVTTLGGQRAPAATRVIDRAVRNHQVHLPRNQASWLPSIQGVTPGLVTRTLADVCRKVSCGVATGSDSVFVIRNAHLDDGIRPFAHPTIAGRQLVRGAELRPLHSLLVPYSEAGDLIPETGLGVLKSYLMDPVRLGLLRARTCTTRKPWYAFHETPPLREMLRPKILCKDITAEPFFVIDRQGQIVPRHSVYYIVPKDPNQLDSLAAYLNSSLASTWLKNHCQRAANGFLRLQSHVLKRLPVPAEFSESSLGGREVLSA